MPKKPKIRPWPYLQAWAMQLLAPRMAKDVATVPSSRTVGAPDLIEVPTRHGVVRCFVHRPHPEAPLNAAAEGRPPLLVYLGGGGFILRHPRGADYITSYLAAEIGCAVLVVDYSAAPQVTYPVAEEQCLDVLLWAASQGSVAGWDGERISVGGGSAGAKLAVNLIQQAAAEDGPKLKAAALTYPVLDVTRTDRTSELKRPLISPRTQRLVANTYFVDASRRHELLASPILDVALPAMMPPTLVQVAEQDTLAQEGVDFAARMDAAGTPVQLSRYPGDHGYIGLDRDGVVRSVREVGSFLLEHM